jgi:hypothetical protein
VSGPPSAAGAPPETSPADDAFTRLARESGRILGELGVRPDDDAWIRLHAETIASLFRAQRRSGGTRLLRRLYRLARRAARTAR